MQRNAKPVTWRPRGVSDTLDSSQSFKGAMSALQNLIPDPTTSGLWECRPASILRVDLAGGAGGPFSSGWSSGFQHGFIAPVGPISALKVLGNFAYGMVSTGLNPGKDQPFAVNLLTNAVVAVTGVTNANTPTTQASTGAWTPPTMALIGAQLIVTHPGFAGGANGYFGVFDLTNPAAPAWSSGNLTGAVTFTVPPSGVAQFNERAYYIENVPAQPSVIFSDSLDATNVTNANQVLTFGDNVALTGFGPLALFNQLGGVIQSLMVFKNVSNIFQITGDAATSDLAVNSLNITTGTLAVNTIVSTPKGLAFVSPDGVRVIDFDAKVSDPLGIDGQGIAAPFIYTVVPSRMAAACAGNILRISTQNGNVPGSPNQEWWYDFARGIWSGPHTFPASLIQPYQNTFITAPIARQGSLWQSDVVQSGTSSFVENGQQMTWNWTTSMLPDTDLMTENAMTESVLDMTLPSSVQNTLVNALDQNSTILNNVAIVSSGAGTIWGAFNWGAALWGGLPTSLAPRSLPWTAPIVFVRLQIQATGQSAQGTRIGTLHLRYQILRYLSNLQAVA